ncbi:MAG: sugar ABC transporter ATP-binding protein [Actinobacteria bacterium]|nr:sugar ABC transporter ATP-binding protein [Actinomycetota bacterium]
MNKNFINLKNISKNFGAIRALDSVDFSIEKGEVHSLMGENGSGKSTLIKIISGVYRAGDGSEINIEGKRYQRYSVSDSINKGIQVIYQDLSIFPSLTVAENIAFNYLFERGTKFIKWKEMNNIAERAMEKVKIKLNF